MATGKFHINRKRGEVGPCGATQGKCPYGSPEEHYGSLVEAAQAYESSMETELLPTVSRANAEPGTPPQQRSHVYGPDLDLGLPPGEAEALSKAVLATRNYGFPEDELGRHNQDMREAELMEDAARGSGYSKQEIRARIFDSVPLERHGLESWEDGRIERRMDAINLFTRPTSAHLMEYGNLDRERCIRRLQSLQSDPQALYTEARELIERGHIDPRDVGRAVGTPRPKTIDFLKRSDPELADFWQERWNSRVRG